VFRAQRSPQGQASMICVGERPATADRNHARIADLREDHAASLPVSTLRSSSRT
jgi:hypothetical protein